MQTQLTSICDTQNLFLSNKKQKKWKTSSLLVQESFVLA
jgi:hypothetical protein